VLAADTPDYVKQCQLNIYIIEEFMLSKSGNKPNPKDLEKLLKEILDSVPVVFMRCVANKSLRYWTRTGQA
jgi:hypothetical protein